MEWKTFFATFGALFLAEMGDKTQLAAISMTSKSGRPLSVFLGGVLALAAVTLIGVLAGEGLTRLVPEEYIKHGAAALFIIIGALMWFDVL
ncbi:MAG: TMEM165/GDT1 family protein [bacterium]